MGELKPCPFCGAGETHIRLHDYWTGQRSTIISVTIMHHCKEKPFQNLIQINGKTEEEAVMKWNTRAAIKGVDDA